MHQGDTTGLYRPVGGGGVRWDRAVKILATASGTWRVRVLLAIDSGKSRPKDIVAAVNAHYGPLSDKVMYDTLNGLVKDKLAIRRKVRACPPETHYFLTPDGRAILDEVAKLGAAEGRRPDFMGYADEEPPPGVDIGKPSVARIWDYAIGGKNHFAVDRETAAAVQKELPLGAEAARASRAFLGYSVRMALRQGVRQFLDIGTGLPTTNNVHEVAQGLHPESRIVYVDNDPSVLLHARVLLNSTPEGASDYIHADLRDPGKILARAADTLDFTKPVAVMLVMVLHFVPDEEDPWGIVRRLMDGISSTAYLAISHVGSDIVPEAARAAADRYNKRSPSDANIHLRSREEVTRFFDQAGAEILGFDASGAAVPGTGVLTLSEWSQQAGETQAPPGLNGYVGIGRRPASLSRPWTPDAR